MNKLIKIPAIICATGAGLFAASIAVYFFNLDMKVISAVVPLLDKQHDRIERKPIA